METTSFTEAYKYVNERYIFNAENYPALGELSFENKQIFIFKHAILHMFKNYDLLPIIPNGEWMDINDDNWVKTINPVLVAEKHMKTALLKTFVNILSLCNSVGITERGLGYLGTFSEQTLIEYFHPEFPRDHLLSLKDCTKIFLLRMVKLLEAADHGEIDFHAIRLAVENLYGVVVFQFGHVEWLPELLEEIPNVMKSK